MLMIRRTLLSSLDVRDWPDASAADDGAHASDAGVAVTTDDRGSLFLSTVADGGGGGNGGSGSDGGGLSPTHMRLAALSGTAAPGPVPTPAPDPAPATGPCGAGAGALDDDSSGSDSSDSAASWSLAYRHTRPVRVHCEHGHARSHLSLRVRHSVHDLTGRGRLTLRAAEDGFEWGGNGGVCRARGGGGGGGCCRLGGADADTAAGVWCNLACVPGCCPSENPEAIVDSNPGWLPGWRLCCRPC
jgi:hypothetical protein